MLELGGVDPIRGRKEGKLDEGELPPIPDTGVTPDITMLMRQCSAARFHSVSFSKPNPVWFGKDTPKKCVGFSKPIPVWFGKKKWNFARRRFQTKFRLVWKKLMTIVNLMKIPNQI